MCLSLFGCGAEARRSTSSGSDPSDSAGALCPSLGRHPDEPLLVAREGRRRTLLSATGEVMVRHSMSFDGATEAFFEADGEITFAALQYGASDGPRAWELVRFDSEGAVVASESGTVASPSTPDARALAPTVRRDGERIAFDLADSDTWLFGFDGAPELRRCAQHKALGRAEEPGWLGVELRGALGPRFAFVNEESGACERVFGEEATTTFLAGRFQTASAQEFNVSFRDRGPSGQESVPLQGTSHPADLELFPVSDRVLYVLSVPHLTKYDVRAREHSTVTLPDAPRATRFETLGEHVLGFAGSVPLWSFDVVSETLVALSLDAPADEAPALIGDDFLLLTSAGRPMTWVDLATGEQRPFDVPLPDDAELELAQFDTTGLVIAEGRPIAFFDLDTGSAVEIELGPGVAATLTDVEGAIVVLDGIPAFLIGAEDGEVREVRAAAELELGGEAETRRSGDHIVVFDAGVPRALLVREGDELVALDGATDVPEAVTLISNERFVVGLDSADWPVFRIDASTRTLTAYAVTGPKGLVSLRDEQYVLAPGDEVFAEHYAPKLSDAAVLDDGSVAVVLRDARQARLWSLDPDDTAFRPIGRPFTSVVDVNFRVADHYIQVDADRGDCFCVPPTSRWEPGADSDVMPAGTVQLVSRAHPSLVLVRQDHLVESDPSGACLVEPAAPGARIHDLVAGTTRVLEDPSNAVSCLMGASSD